MTLRQALIKYEKVEIDLLLSEVLKKPREFLYLNPEKRLSADQLISLSALVKRRLKGEPIAYILGYKDFMGLRFRVNKHTLIPRPETEEMVERIMKYELGSKNQGKLRVLDVGTGSACIIVSIAKLLKPKSYNLKPEFYASDISPQALRVAKENAKAQKASVKFVLSDLLHNIRGQYDIIIANLPYVPNADFRMLNADLKYEPKTAIFAKENGLAIIKKFLYQLSKSEILNPKSVIYLEFDPRQKVVLSKLIKKILPFYKVEFFKDLNNFWRYVQIKH